MRNDKLTLGFAYLRLSNEEAQGGESSSITNQRMIVQNYCKQNGITLVREFVDDGYSGGNFDRPAFQEMMKQLQQGKANTVITKDLSRLGRDMREASYYAEQFFPEHGIHYIAISDNFDTERENLMAPFPFRHERGLPAGRLPQGQGCDPQQARERPVLRLSSLRLPQGHPEQAPLGSR